MTTTQPGKPVLSQTEHKSVTAETHHANRAFVRYNKLRGEWALVAHNYRYVYQYFCAGLMMHPFFVGKSEPMRIVGWESTGEAIGPLDFRLNSPCSSLQMPPEVTFCAYLFYDKNALKFYIKGTEYEVTDCHCITFNPNGSATCGWLVRPQDMPNVGWHVAQPQQEQEE